MEFVDPEVFDMTGNRNRNTNAGQKNGQKKSGQGRNDPGQAHEILDIDEFIRRMVSTAQNRLMSPDIPSLTLDGVRRLITSSQNEARDVSDQSTTSTEIPLYDSDTSETSNLKSKNRTVKRKRFNPYVQKRVLYHPTPFLTYIAPEEYSEIPSDRNLPLYPHNALPLPWGVRLPLPKSQRNSPDLPVCSPLPLFPPDNIMAFSYQHSSRHYQLCADSKAEQKLEWL